MEASTDRSTTAEPKKTRARLAAAAAEATAAEEAGDTWGANAAWNRYQLIANTLRDPSELFAEQVAFAEFAARLNAAPGWQ